MYSRPPNTQLQATGSTSFDAQGFSGMDEEFGYEGEGLGQDDFVAYEDAPPPSDHFASFPSQAHESFVENAYDDSQYSEVVVAEDSQTNHDHDQQQQSPDMSSPPFADTSSLNLEAEQQYHEMGFVEPHHQTSYSAGDMGFWQPQPQPRSAAATATTTSYRAAAAPPVKRASTHPQVRSFVEKHESMFVLFRDKPSATGTFARAFTDSYLQAQVNVLEKNVHQMHEKKPQAVAGESTAPSVGKSKRKIGVKRSIAEVSLGEGISEYGGGFTSTDEIRKFLSSQKFIEFLAFQRLMDINQRVFEEGVKSSATKDTSKEVQTEGVQVFARSAPRSMPFYEYHPSALLPTDRMLKDVPAVRYQLAADAGDNPTLAFFTVVDDPQAQRFEMKSKGITFGKRPPTTAEQPLDSNQLFLRSSTGPTPQVDVDLTQIEHTFSQTGRCLISRVHAHVYYDSRRRMFILLNYGRNGTVVDDVLYTDGPVNLANECVLRFGHVQVVFHVSRHMSVVAENAAS